MRDHVILYVNGRRHEVRGERPFRSLADFLRYDLGLVGTKVVCAEGDCGSCVGNLCRCTGYEPSLRAGTSVEPASMRPLNELYPPREMTSDFAARAGEAVEVGHAVRLFFKPATVEQAVRFRADHPDCTVI